MTPPPPPDPSITGRGSLGEIDEQPSARDHREGRLLIGRCPACGTHLHPDRPVCPECGVAPERVPAAGTGEIDAWTVVRRSPGPGFDPPYVVARVRLTEGPVLLTSLPGTGPYRCGDAVRHVPGSDPPAFDLQEQPWTSP